MLYHPFKASLHSVQSLQLDFTLDSIICQGIDEAQTSHAQITDQLNIQCMEYDKYGYSFLKECRVSPDAVAQLALQVRSTFIAPWETGPNFLELLSRKYSLANVSAWQDLTGNVPEAMYTAQKN